MTLRLCVATFASLLALVPSICAQNSSTALATPKDAASKKFSYADLLRLRSVHDVEISPDGERIVYTVSGIDEQKDRSVESMWVLRVADKQTVRVDLPSASVAAWSPDGHQIAVVSQSEDGKSTLTLLRAEDLQATRSFPIPSSPRKLAWSPDGKSLAFSLFVQDAAQPSFLQEAVNRAEQDLGKPPGAQWAAPVELTQEARYRQDGGIWLQSGHHHLFLISTANGMIRQIGTGEFDDTDPTWMPDSGTLLFTSDRRPERSRSVHELEIYKTELVTGNVVQLTHANGSFSNPSASPDGKWIAYVGSAFRPVNYTRSDLYLMRPDGTDSHRLATLLDRDIYATRWTSDAQGIYAEYPDHGITRIGLVTLDGKVKELASGVDSGFSSSRKGELAYAGSTINEPSTLKLQRAVGDPVVLLSLNEFLHERELGHVTHLEALSAADGLPIEGWALLPADASERTRLPTIFILHGGPFGADGPTWSSSSQLYAAAGYAVVDVNYRGSTSYGSKFAEPANYDFPGASYESVMSLVDEAIKRGFAGPQRLFITGGSSGGQLTAWITGKTKRFRAAVAEKPVINEMSESLTTDQYLGAAIVEGGNPWLRDRQLWALSPLSLAGSMTTPMLFIVGEQDYRTPIDQSLQLYGALQLQNVPTALMRVPGAGHESLASRPSQFAAELAAILAWFHQYDAPPSH
jgi:dipeptidyl aminopeptidase/acylaminoacyl peptidase